TVCRNSPRFSGYTVIRDVLTIILGHPAHDPYPGGVFSIPISGRSTCLTASPPRQTEALSYGSTVRQLLCTALPRRLRQVINLLIDGFSKDSRHLGDRGLRA